MKSHRICVSHSATFRLLRVLFVLQLLAVSFNANAAYTWVMGSFKSANSAAAMVSSDQFVKIGAISVKTRAPGYARRILAGCFETREAAMQERARYVSVRNNRGIWLLRSDLACRKNETSVMQEGSEIAQAADMLNVGAVQRIEGADPSPEFKPKKWKFAGGGKVAYTDGENPAVFFTNAPCRMTINHRVPDLASVAPPSDVSSYSFRATGEDGVLRDCKVAYIYEVQQ